MVSRVRIFLLVRSIIGVNWILSKLAVLLAHESVMQLMEQYPEGQFDDKKIIIRDQFCYLDDCFEESGNGRKSLSMWKYRIRAED